MVLSITDNFLVSGYRENSDEMCALLLYTCLMNLFMLPLGCKHECGGSCLEKKVQKMGGFQVCNEASKAPLARKQTRASVMSRETRWWWEGHGEGRVACYKLELSQKL